MGTAGHEPQQPPHPPRAHRQRLLAPASEKSVLAGRGHYRHALRLPLDEHAVIFSPPRGGKTGWLARVILHYPGPVLSTTTKHDVFAADRRRPRA